MHLVYEKQITMKMIKRSIRMDTVSATFASVRWIIVNKFEMEKIQVAGAQYFRSDRIGHIFVVFLFIYLYFLPTHCVCVPTVSSIYFGNDSRLHKLLPKLWQSKCTNNNWRDIYVNVNFWFCLFFGMEWILSPIHLLTLSLLMQRILLTCLFCWRSEYIQLLSWEKFTNQFDSHTI